MVWIVVILNLKMFSVKFSGLPDFFIYTGIVFFEIRIFDSFPKTIKFPSSLLNYFTVFIESALCMKQIFFPFTVIFNITIFIIGGAASKSLSKFPFSFISSIAIFIIGDTISTRACFLSNDHYT